MTTDAARVPFDRPPRPGQREASFCAVTAWAPVYEGYRGVPEAERGRPHAVALLVDRWDGRVGFPGGAVDPGESPLDAALRELFEEAGLRLARPPAPLVAHDCGGVLARLYHADLGAVRGDDLRRIAAGAAAARDAVAEGFAVWRHFAAYRHGAGLAAVLASGNLAPAVADEIEALAAALAASAPPGAAPLR